MHQGVILGLFLLLSLWSGAAPAAAPEPKPPPGFELLLSERGVWLYRRLYRSGAPDFVQVVDLSQGAGVRLLHAPLAEPRPQKGVWGGPDPRFGLRSLEAYWQEAAASSPYAFCVANGQFFYMPETPTRLALPLKMDGVVLTEGFGYPQYEPKQRLMLELWAGHAAIHSLTQEALYASTAPDILGGLAEDANKRARSAVGRTFVGVEDRDGDGRSETLYVLNTSIASQVDAAGALREFGARQVMMLDGGGSTQLICRGQEYVASERPIPQALAVLAAPPPLVAARGPEEPLWLVALEAEHVQLLIQLQNEGQETWQPGEHQLSLASSALSSGRAYDFPAAVAPGEGVSFTLSLASYSTAGLYPASQGWRIVRRGELFPGKALALRIVVLPASLSARRGELRAAIQQWQRQPDVDVSAQVRAWLRQQKVSIDPLPPPTQIELQDVLLIPLLMLPFLVLILIFLLRH